MLVVKADVASLHHFQAKEMCTNETLQTAFPEAQMYGINTLLKTGHNQAEIAVAIGVHISPPSAGNCAAILVAGWMEKEMGHSVSH
jgi:hypothetical protein